MTTQRTLTAVQPSTSATTSTVGTGFTDAEAETGVDAAARDESGAGTPTSGSNGTGTCTAAGMGTGTGTDAEVSAAVDAAGRNGSGAGNRTSGSSGTADPVPTIPLRTGSGSGSGRSDHSSGAAKGSSTGAVNGGSSRAVNGSSSASGLGGAGRGSSSGVGTGGGTYPMAAASGKARRQGGGGRRQTVPTQGALALRYDVAEELVSPPRPRLRLLHGGPALPDAQAWSTRLVQAIVEVLAGDRPISQLIRWTDSPVFMDLNRRVRLLGLTTTATKRGAKDRGWVRSVHVSRPTENVVEVAAHVRSGDRSRAVALRLETRRGRWVCTALELG